MLDRSGKVSVCIVSHNAYGAISGGTKGFIGGVERQTSLLAKWLAAQGHRVSLVTWNEGGPLEEEIDGVRVLKICPKDAGLPGLRFFHPKWTGLNAALAKADADVYYQNCGECVTGQISLWCRRHHKPFVFSVASDADCDPHFPELKTRRERLLYMHGLRHADRVVAQTAIQQQMLQNHFGIRAQVVPMPCPGPSVAGFTPPSRASKRVLWVGRVCRVKRPDRLLEIAAACPEVHFDLIGPIYDDEFAQSVALAAQARPNVTVHGAVQRDAMTALYRAASLLCCTSDYEGFPNTFLEAWSHGLPVVSTVEPDTLISRKDLGCIGTDAAALSRGIDLLLDSETLYARQSAAARAYYQENHTMETVLPQFERIFAELAVSQETISTRSVPARRLSV